MGLPVLAGTLLALLHAAAAVSLIGAKLPDGSCLSAARQHPPESHWLHALKPKSRARPQLTSHHHGVSDWPEGVLPDQAHAGERWHRCTGDVFRYRVVHGVVYADHDHHDINEIYQDYREVFLEQLLTAMYLYEGDFPDVELYVNMADLPVPCNLNLPFMQYNVIDTRGLDAHHMDIQLSHLVWRDGDRTMPQPGDLPAGNSSLGGYTHGVTLPFTHTWDRVSLSHNQLRSYTACLDAKHSPNGWAAKKQALIWRGSPTGYQRGWEKGAASGDWGEHGGSYAARALLNKRIYLAAMALHYPWMDVGITGWGPYGPWETAGDAQGSVHRDLVNAFNAGYVDAEAWSEYMLQLSMDGHGTPWRLPQQLLGGSAMLIMESPLKGFLTHLLKPGVHYQPAAYDLSDIVMRTKALLYEAQLPGGVERLHRMAMDARDVAVRHLGALGQLDAFMWSVLKVKELCPWPIRKPVGGEWKVVELKQTRHWISYGTAPVKEAIMRAQRANFV